MVSNSPLVSIIITTHYREQPLIRAIESVRDQQYQPIEVIVVDDSGERFAEPIVNQFADVQYIAHKSNQGQISAWETGLKNTAGKYIQLHDDDDWLDPSKIRKQVQSLQQTSEVGVIYCGIKHRSGMSIFPLETARGNILDQTLMFKTYPCQTTSMLIDRSAIESVFPLKRYNAATDDVLKIELAKVTQFDYVDQLLVFRDDTTETIEDSYEKIHSQLQLFSDYGDLYGELDESSIKMTKADRYFELGLRYLRRNAWSYRAIGSLIKSNYYHPGYRSDYFFALIASIFGRPGYRTAQKVRNRIVEYSANIE